MNGNVVKGFLLSIGSWTSGKISTLLDYQNEIVFVFQLIAFTVSIIAGIYTIAAANKKMKS